MALFARTCRYLLNINTIWGLMILASFGLCVFHHYAPTTTAIPADRLVSGENVLCITAPGPGSDAPQAFTFLVHASDNTLTLADADRQPSRARPRLIAARPVPGGFLLSWDYEKPGPYSIALRHFQSLDAPIPLANLQSGPNTLILRRRPGSTVEHAPPETHAYTVTVADEAAFIPPDQQAVRLDRPLLTAVRRTDAGYVLTWDRAPPADYELAVHRVLRTGRLITLQSMSDAALEYAKRGFEIALGLIAAMVMFLGLMKVGEDAGIVQLVARLFYPLIRVLFPDVPRDHPANGAIVMNWTTTLLGLGNAATPFGLKAMQELQRLNPNPKVASDAQIMLLGYNTAGLAIVPTTLLAIRKSAGCTDPFEIIGTCIFAGFIATVTAIVMVKLLGALPVFSVRAAASEDAPAAAPHTPDAEDR